MSNKTFIHLTYADGDRGYIDPDAVVAISWDSGTKSTIVSYAAVMAHFQGTPEEVAHRLGIGLRGNPNASEITEAEDDNIEDHADGLGDLSE